MDTINELMKKMNATNDYNMHLAKRVEELEAENKNIRISGESDIGDHDPKSLMVNASLEEKKFGVYPTFTLLRKAKEGEVSKSGIMRDLVKFDTKGFVHYTNREDFDFVNAMKKHDKNLANMNAQQKIEYLYKELKKALIPVHISWQGMVPAGTVFETRGGFGRNWYQATSVGMCSLTFKEAMQAVKGEMVPAEGKEPVQLQEEGAVNGGGYQNGVTEDGISY